MSQLIKIKSGDSEFWIEPDITAITERKLVMASVASEISTLDIDFDKFSKQISDIYISLKKSLDEVPDGMKPKKVSIEFGIKISGEGNIYVVKTGAEATLKITAEWQFS